MNVSQEPDTLHARAIRATAIGLLLATVLCASAAALVLRLSAGHVAPPGFVAGRVTLAVRELSGIELGLLSTESGRGERQRDSNPLSLATRPAPPPRLSLDQAIDAYLRGERAPSQNHGVKLDYTSISPEAAR